jgi:Zn ribbon nucleic-acid-binding protein
MNECPTCAYRGLMHTWRTDMNRLRWIDEWKCLRCGFRWTDTSIPTDAPRARH